jgi:hypothetical protein
MTAVFLHSGWRTGSTYIWNQFRRQPGTLAYYEPLHERLDRPGEDLTRVHWDAETSHHPALDAPYFSEYRPLIEDGRIGLFQPEFSYRRFFLSAEDQEPALRRYLQMLIEHAGERNRKAVLGFSRSLGRVGWLKQNFDAVHLRISRNPRRQWASIHHQRAKYRNPYFLVNQFLISGQNRTHPALRPLIERYDIPLIQTSCVSNDIALYQKIFDGIGSHIAYMVFYYLWRLTQAMAEPHCEILVDVDRLSSDSAYRIQTTAAIQARTGLTPSFDDAISGRPDVAMPELDYARIEAFVESLLANVFCNGNAYSEAVGRSNED